MSDTLNDIVLLVVTISRSLYVFIIYLACDLIPDIGVVQINNIHSLRYKHHVIVYTFGHMYPVLYQFQSSDNA